MTFQLAACAEMIFTDLPFAKRVKEISAAGYLVEIWDWSNKDLPALAATGSTFSSMTGYLEGDLITDEGANRLLETAALSLEQAKIIDAPRLNLHGTGLGEGGLPVKPTYSVSDADWHRAVETLTRMADLAAKHNRVFTLENLNNAVDHPGVPFAKAADTLELVKRVNHPHLRLNLDLYHAQIGEGNLTQLVNECFEWIGEIQVADVPGRAQPGSGEIYYPRIAKELKSLNYQGVIAMEAFATGESHQALAEFRSAFTV